MSTASKLFSDEELKEILSASQVNNERDHITGMLLYSEDTFLQVLEGEKEALDKTYERILEDTRHKGVIELARGELAERNFPNWSMGFKTLSPEEFCQFDAFIDSPDSDTFGKSTSPAFTMLKTFAKTGFQ
jgi:hypothetical protein